MAPDTAHQSSRPANGVAEGGVGIPLLTLVLSGALRMNPPEPSRMSDAPRDG